MLVDHIFIFSNQLGKEADDLLRFGFTEGSSRIHPGQGTVNRKFYFENFFLEILWVHEETEIKNKVTAPTKLWKRSQFFTNDYSPFGLCFVNTEATDILFEEAKLYQPNYFPKGMSIDMITNESQPAFPFTFRLPYRGKPQKTTEPITHANHVQQLTKVIFEIADTSLESLFVKTIEKENCVHFKVSQKNHLTLEFDQNRQKKRQEFPKLQLTIAY